MKHSKKEIFEQAKNIIVENSFLFMEDVIAKLPIQKSAFYKMFPASSEENEALKKELAINKIEQKIKIRRKWEDSDNFQSQHALYKLIATDEERKRLSQTFIEIGGDQEKPLNAKFKFGK